MNENDSTEKRTPGSLHPAGSASGLTLAAVVERIAQCGAKYKTDYGVEPFDVCLGPAEFHLIYREGRSANEQPPDWHYKLAPMFYKGMRVRLMNTPGVLVGTLTSKTPNASNSATGGRGALPAKADGKA